MTIFSTPLPALDLNIQGTTGSFSVVPAGGTSSIEVKYLLTHVSLAENQTRLLEALAPVREILPIEQLDFDSIMQRDIDDARVATELIPYLVSASRTGEVKLFPPIVAVVLPRNPLDGMPRHHYSEVRLATAQHHDNPEITVRTVTAGPTGSEEFQFVELFRGDSKLWEGSVLRLSSSHAALAIVDGQHRAMALLALYRNKRGGWNDGRRSGYADFYRGWPASRIEPLDLRGLQLPVMICAFPQLDPRTRLETDVIGAARHVFLTLNKSAKKVSDSRNKLLNDQDLVAECLRELLSSIKDGGRTDSFRIWNVELDQEGDRMRVTSPTAYSGVTHLYYMTEQILMSSDPVRDTAPRPKVGAPRRNLGAAIERLGLREEMTAETREANTRFNYSPEVRRVFRDRFRHRFVPIICRLLGGLWPYEQFGDAAIALHDKLRAEDPVQFKALFDGQSTARAYSDLGEGLSRRIKEGEIGWDTPEMRAARDRIAGLLHTREGHVQSMRESRASRYLSDVQGDDSRRLKVAPPHDAVLAAVDKLYDTVFATVAFQTAVVCTFTEAVFDGSPRTETEIDHLLEEYLASLNQFFKPTSKSRLIDQTDVLAGTLNLGERIEFSERPSALFRQVVLHGELQPAEWPKFRYLLLEIWHPTDDHLRPRLDEDRKRSRQKVASAFIQKRLSARAEELSVLERDLSKAEQAACVAHCKETHQRLLNRLGLLEPDLDPFYQNSSDPTGTTAQSENEPSNPLLESEELPD